MTAKISLRVSLHLWNVDQRRRELLRLLRDYRGVIDEVALFTGVTHPPRPLAEVRRLADKLGRVLPEFAALGLSCGINHLATIGHLDEDLDHSLNEPWQRMVDVGGRSMTDWSAPSSDGPRWASGRPARPTTSHSARRPATGSAKGVSIPPSPRSASCRT